MQERPAWLVVGPVGHTDLSRIARVPAGTKLVGHEVRMYGRELWICFEGDAPPEPIAPFKLVGPVDVPMPKE